MIRLFAILLVLAAAFPLRLRYQVGPFRSISLLDIALLAASATLLLLAFVSGKKIRIGDRAVFGLLLVPLLVGVVSLVWSEDVVESFRYLAIFSEAVVAYVVFVNLFGQLRIEQTMHYLACFVLLLLLGSLCSLLRVPGFEPTTYGMDEGGPEYLNYLASYYSRLSHPFYGLSNDFASVLALFVYPFFGWGVASRRRRFVILSGLTFTAVVLTLSRGVVAALVISGAVFAVLTRRLVAAWVRGIVFASVLLFGIGYIYYESNESVQTHLLDRLSLANVEARREKLAIALARISDAPFVGYGAGAAAHNEPALAGGVHNTFVEQILYFGIPLGLVVTGTLWLLAVRFVTWRTSYPQARLVAAAFGSTVLGHLLIFLTQTSFEATLPRIAFYFAVGIGSVALQNLGWRDAHPGAVRALDVSLS